MLARRLISRTAGAGGYNAGLLTDPNCMAWWRMLSGGLLVDSKNSQTLTNVNGVAECTALKDDVGCAKFLDASDKYLSISQNDTVSGFPMKSGESNLSFSLCFYVKLTRSTLESLFQCGYYSFRMALNGNKIFVRIANSTNILHGTAMTVGKLYHVGFTFDGNNGPNYAYRIRVWNVTDDILLGSDLTGTMTSNISNSSPFYIGYTQTWAQFDGYMAGVVMTNNILTPPEIDDIRQGTF